MSPPSGCPFHTRCPRKLGAMCETEPPPEQMAEDFEAALRKVGAEVELKRIDGCTHQNIVKLLHRDGTEATRLVLDFIKKHAAQAPRSGS